MTALGRGDFDVVLNGFEPTPARRDKVRFSRPYYVFSSSSASSATPPSGSRSRARWRWRPTCCCTTSRLVALA